MRHNIINMFCARRALPLSALVMIAQTAFCQTNAPVPAAASNSAPTVASTSTNTPAPPPPVSQLLLTGKAALEDNLYPIAEKKLEAYLKTDAKTPEDKLSGSLLLGQALYGQKKYKEMLDLLGKSAAQTKGTPHECEHTFWTGAAYYNTTQYDKALEQFSGFEQKYTNSPYVPQVLRMRAAAFRDTGKTDEAIKTFAAFDQKFGSTPEAPENLLQWSRTLIAANRPQDARKVLEKLVAMNLPNAVGMEGRLNLGKVCMLQKDYAKGEEALLPMLDEKARIPDGLRAQAVFALADLNERQAKLPEAVKHLKKGVQLISNPSLKQEAKLRMGRIMLETEQINEGIALLREFVAANSTNAVSREVQLSLAQTLYNKGLYEKAVTEYQNFLETFRDQEGLVQASKGKGAALFKLDRYAEAADSFNKAFGLSVDPVVKEQCLFKIGDCHFADEQFEAAFRTYMRVLSEFPKTTLAPQIRFQSAECQVKLGRLDNAEDIFQDIIEDFPSNPLASEAFLRIGDIKERNGKWEEAIKVYQTLLKSGASKKARLGALHRVGTIMYRLGRFSQALTSFQDLVREYPDSELSAQARYMCGWCHLMLGSDGKALSIFEDFIKQYPDSPWTPDVIFWTGEYEYNKGAYDKAEQRFTSLVNNYPKADAADNALFWSGRSALMRKEYLRANEHFNMLIKQYPNSTKRPETRFFQAEALCELGEFASAILALEEIIKNYPDSYLVDRAWLRKGDSQFTLGADDPKRYEEAMASYKVVLDREDATPEDRMQADYKIGRCLDKLGRKEEAFERYMSVVYSYFTSLEKGVQLDHVLFTRAAFHAAEIKEEEKSWRKAVKIYERVIDAGVPASKDALERINRIRLEHWLFFY